MRHSWVRLAPPGLNSGYYPIGNPGKKGRASGTDLEASTVPRTEFMADVSHHVEHQSRAA